LVSRCLGAVVGVAQAAAVPGVVGVELAEHELASAERVVVSDGGWLFAAVEDADWVALENGGAEPGVCLAAVAALGRSASCLLCLLLVSLAPTAGGEGGAAWDGADALGSGAHVVGAGP
jgi:hypothetical protein